MSSMEDIKNSVPTDDERRIIESEKTKLRRQQQARREVQAEAQGPVPDLIVVGADKLQTYHFPQREALICRDEFVVFRAGHIGELFATRGVGKTWVLLTLGLMISTGGKALGFQAPNARRVLYVDGEMASHDIRDRIAELSRRTGLEMTHFFQILGADWQTEHLPRLDTVVGQESIEPHVRNADVIILDNRSCLFDPEGEKDATAWQPAGEYLLSLRRRGKGVLLAHHANRQGAARGHSVAEDPMNLIVKLTRPEGYTSDQGAKFIWEFDKCRGIYGPAAAPFLTELTPNGWVLNSPNAGGAPVRDKIIEYLKLAEAANDLPKSANAVIRTLKLSRNKGLEAWGAMLKAGEVVGDNKAGFRIGTLRAQPF